MFETEKLGFVLDPFFGFMQQWVLHTCRCRRFNRHREWLVKRALSPHVAFDMVITYDDILRTKSVPSVVL